jgi:hypothetical protein
MIRLLFAFFALIALSCAANAQDQQQQRMIECNRSAGSLAGDERKAFMLDCLRTPTIATTQQVKKETPSAPETTRPKDAPPLTASWFEFKNSNYAEDQKLVASVEKMKWWDACTAWGREARSGKSPRREAVLNAYLKSQRMLSLVDGMHVMDRSIEIGMTECGVFASRGIPERANHTTTAQGTTSQLVYSSPRLYVYTEESPEYAVKVVRSYQH